MINGKVMVACWNDATEEWRSYNSYEYWRLPPHTVSYGTRIILNLWISEWARKAQGRVPRYPSPRSWILRLCCAEIPPQTRPSDPLHKQKQFPLIHLGSGSLKSTLHTYKLSSKSITNPKPVALALAAAPTWGFVIVADGMYCFSRSISAGVVTHISLQLTLPNQ